MTKRLSSPCAQNGDGKIVLTSFETIEDVGMGRGAQTPPDDGLIISNGLVKFLYS